MSRILLSAAAASLFVLGLAACTTATPASPPGGDPAGNGAPTTNVPQADLPTCDAITAAIGALPGDLVFNQQAADNQTAPEAYAQRVCVYTNADETVQVGVTVAEIPFQQTEIDHYRTLPNSIPDERTETYEGVLQTLQQDDAANGQLDSPLYLFDVNYSITIQAISITEPLASVLPGLSVEAAADAAFAVRALLE